MIHSHYDGEQILWFLRNYWKFTRENMILEFRRTFHDENFAKSQYQWLKTRYGMKEEWGASLNNPPYSGARPGGPGTDMYEPPDIPTDPPQLSFRSSRETPTPALVLARLPVSSESKTQHHATDSRSRVVRGSASRCFPPDNCDYTAGTSLSTTQTPMNMAAGSPSLPTANMASGGAYPVNSQSTPLSTDGLNGTYKFNLAQELGSPFVPTGQTISHDDTFNASTATGNMATLNASFAMPMPAYAANPSRSLNSGRLPENHAMTTHPVGQQVNSNQEHLLLAAFPFPTAQPSQFVGGQYGVAFPNQTASAQQWAEALGPQGLPVSQGLQQGCSASKRSPFVSIENTMRAANIDTNAYGSIGGGSNSRYPLLGYHAGNAGSHNLMETVASHHSILTPAGPISKRKRKVVEVECRPPTLTSFLDPTLQISGGSAGIPSGSPEIISAAQAPMQQHHPQDNRESSGGAALKRHKRANVPIAASSRTVPTTTASASVGDWHDGVHGNCDIHARHRHQDGGVFFAQKDDILAAAIGCMPSTNSANSPKTPMTTSNPINNYAGAGPGVGVGRREKTNVNSTASYSSFHTPNAATLQSSSLALAQAVGLDTRNLTMATSTIPDQNTTVVRDFAVNPHLQTPKSSRQNSLIMPANSRPASGNIVYTGSPPSTVMPPDDRIYGTVVPMAWEELENSIGDGNVAFAANSNSSTGPADACTVAMGATLSGEASNIQAAGTQINNTQTINSDTGIRSVDIDFLLLGVGAAGADDISADACAFQSDPVIATPMSSGAVSKSSAAAVENVYSTPQMAENRDSNDHRHMQGDSNEHDNYTEELFPSPRYWFNL